VAHYSGRQHREARDARENVDTSRSRGGIERSHARYEFRTIGKVQVVDSLSDARLDEAIAPFSISLKRSARVHEYVRRQRSKLLRRIAISIKCRRHEPRDGVLARRTEGGPLTGRTPGDDNLQARFVFE
jgi:hypothetical protein